MPTRAVKKMRRRKEVSMGTRRKRVMRSKGSTPKFPIDPEKKTAEKSK